MALQPGTYYIMNGDYFIGRNVLEDRSPRPMPIVAIAKRTTEWIVEKLPDGTYIFKANGASVAAQYRALWAIFTGSDNATHWTVKYVGRTGSDDGTFVIKDTDLTGWATGTQTNQLTVDRLIVKPMSPSTYTASEIFKFIKVV